MVLKAVMLYAKIIKDCQGNCFFFIEIFFIYDFSFKFIYYSDKCDWQLRPLDSRNCSDISDCLNGKSTNSQEDSPNNHIVIDSMINEPR